MSIDDANEGPPFMQRLYDRIWLLALLAMVFWTLSYVGWGAFDIVMAERYNVLATGHA